jgi:hypothetical protein
MLDIIPQVFRCCKSSCSVTMVGQNTKHNPSLCIFLYAAVFLLLLSLHVKPVKCHKMTCCAAKTLYNATQLFGLTPASLCGSRKQGLFSVGFGSTCYLFTFCMNSWIMCV